MTESEYRAIPALSFSSMKDLCRLAIPLLVSAREP